jgi:hypothetical protein
VRAAALLVVAAAGLSPASFAAIYTCTDAQGRTVFRDVPCGAAENRSKLPSATRTRSKSREDPAAGGPALDRSKVQSVAKRLHNAMTKRDAKAVLGLLAKDARVQWVLAKDKPRGPALDRAGYGDYLRDVFGRPDYVYQFKSERISLSKRKARATLTRTLREAVLVNGRLQVAEVSERLTIEPDGRRLVVRSLTKTARLAGEPSTAGGRERPSAAKRGSGELASALLAQHDQHDQHDEADAHRDVQH